MCPNIQAYYNEAIFYLNFGTPKDKKNFHLEQMENLLFLGVPMLKHIRVLGRKLTSCFCCHFETVKHKVF